MAGVLAGLLGDAAPLWSHVAGFALLGALRALLHHGSKGITFAAGLRVSSQCRAAIVAREAARSDGPPAGSIAALAAEKVGRAAALCQPLRSSAGAGDGGASGDLGAGILAVLGGAVIFLSNGPLIPVFISLIGWAAQSASQRRMAKIGSLNDLLVERLQALIDFRLLGAGQAVVYSFAEAAARLRAQTMEVLRVAFLSSAMLELFAAIGVVMVAVYFAFSLLGLLGFGSYGAPLTPAAGIFLILLAREFYQPLRDLSAAWHDRAAELAVAMQRAEWQAQPSAASPGWGAAVARACGYCGDRTSAAVGAAPADAAGFPACGRRDDGAARAKWCGQDDVAAPAAG